MPLKSILTNLAWFTGILTAIYTFHKTIGAKLLKLGYNKLMEEQDKSYEITNSKLDQIIKMQLEHSRELGLLSVAQESLFNENEVMWWRSSDEDGTTIKVGDKTAEFLRVDSSELIGTNWLNHVPIEEQKGLMEAYKQSLEFKRDFIYDYTFIRGDKTKVKLSAHAKRPKNGGDWFGILKVAN